MWPQGEGGVLMLLHDLALTRSFVVNAAQVQHAVYDHTTQFVVVLRTALLGVTADSVERNDHVAGDASRGGVVERDDVGIVVVSQELDVGLEDILVVTEQVGESSHLPAMYARHRFDPCRQFLQVELRRIHALCQNCDFGHIKQ